LRGIEQIACLIELLLHRKRLPGFFHIFLLGAVFDEEFHRRPLVKDDAAFAVLVNRVKYFFVHFRDGHTEFTHYIE